MLIICGFEWGVNMRKVNVSELLLVIGAFCCVPAGAEPLCASPEQAQLVRDYYQQNPGASPVAASRQLKLPEALVGSGLPADQAAATSADGFERIWSALTEWEKAIVIVPKGTDVIEVFSQISPGERSPDNPRFNLTHDNPFAGHLRPDLYSAIYAYRIPGKKGAVTRGVIFYDQSGASVFAVMMSGKGPPAPPGEVEKFDGLIALVRSLPSVCPAID